MAPDLTDYTPLSGRTGNKGNTKDQMICEREKIVCVLNRNFDLEKDIKANLFLSLTKPLYCYTAEPERSTEYNCVHINHFGQCQLLPGTLVQPS